MAAPTVVFSRDIEPKGYSSLQIVVAQGFTPAGAGSPEGLRYPNLQTALDWADGEIC
jgi:hypothetical protein